MPVAVGAERAARGESSAGLECDADRTTRIEQRVGRGGAGERVARRECGGAPWRSLPSTRRVVAAEAVSGKSGCVGELHCQRAVAADKSRCGRKEERCLSPCKQRYCAQHSSGTDHRISRNHLLKRGALRNRQKLGNLVLYMTLGSKLALCFKFDCICGRKDSKFDTAAASLSKWTAKSIERGVRAA